MSIIAKVYCEDCKYYRHPRYQNAFTEYETKNHECNHPNCFQYIDTPIRRTNKRVIYFEVKNKDNDCQDHMRKKRWGFLCP
jgi:hypothetical protein